MFKEYLLLASEKNQPISIYTDKDNTEKFAFGFVQGISDDCLLIASITKYGLYDGYVIKKLEDIYRLEVDDKYGKKLRKLYLLHKQKHSKIDLASKNIVCDLLQHAYKNRLIVTLELHDSNYDDLQGFVMEIPSDLIVIKQLDSYGNNDGTSMISLEDITHIACDSENEMTLKLLAENPDSSKNQ